MKYLFFLMFLLLSSNMTQAADQDSTKTIYVITHDDDKTALKKVARIFVAQGFDIETPNEILMILSTKATQKSYGLFGMGKVLVKLNAQIDTEDSLTVIKFTGKQLDAATRSSMGLSSEFDKDSSPIENAGASGSSVKAAWETLVEAAKAYKNGIVKIPE